MDRLSYHGNASIGFLTTLCAWVAFLFQIYFVALGLINIQASIFLLLFSLVTVAILTLRRFNGRFISFTAAFLLSTFSMITTWRISVLVNMPIVPYIFLVALILKFINYLIAAYNDIQASKSEPNTHYHNTRFEWQLLFIRMFVGFDLIPHFCEKLFSGNAVRADDIAAFTHLGISQPMIFVIIAGLFEFGGALSLSCGVLTRLGSICLFIYLMVATYMGHHFSLGFIWASPGGGWEFPVFWSVTVLSFCIFGANYFSIDAYLNQRWKLPAWVKLLMGVRE